MGFAEHRRRQALAQRLMADGVLGWARVIAAEPTGRSDGDRPEMRFDLEILTPPGHDATVVHRQAIARAALPMMAAGATVPIRIDPEDPEQVLIA